MEVNQYLDIFLDESNEHLQNINEQLLQLEKNPEEIQIVNEIFRSAHTLKGMSATMGYSDLAELTHQMENVLDAIRNHRFPFTPDILDIVFEAVDHLEAMISSIANGGDGKRDVSTVVQKLQSIEHGETVSAPVKAEQAATALHTHEMDYDNFELTVLEQSKELGFNGYEITIGLRSDCLLKAARVFMVFDVLEQTGEVIKSDPPVEKLEEEKFDQEFYVTLLSKMDAEELKERIMKVSEIEKVEISSIDFSHLKSADHEQITIEPVEEIDSPKATDIKKIDQETHPNGSQKNGSGKTIRVNIERLDRLMNLFEELVIDRGRLEQISSELNHSGLHETVERMSRTSGDLQNIILNMRMVPVEQVFNRFPRMIRQLARDLNKKINLEVIGAETELDRTVIDEIGDPLVHLLRNAVDHGVETPEARVKAGKPEEGTVRLRAYHSGNHVFIEIEDDGAGINKDKVLNKAIDRGLVTADAAKNLTDKQVYEFILASGFSTADTISDISGRGVGLDVVKNTIESLGGSISIDSTLGQGTIFSIQLPLTLSIISVMLVEIQKEKYAVPLSSIIETAIIKKEAILSAHNQKVIDFRGKVVPLVFLKDLFQVPHVVDQGEYYSVVIVRKGEKIAALVVDSFIGQQEIVLKSLGNYLTNVFAISGATILGDGQVALIIDCNALIK